MKKDKPPPPIVRLETGGLVPVSGWDAELLNKMANGTEFDLVERSTRSLPQHRTYWKALAGVVAATGLSPSAKHLHRDLKLACGYTEKVVNRDTGEIHVMADSIAFDAMTQDEFKAYFNTAMAKLTEWAGYDPLRFLEG